MRKRDLWHFQNEIRKYHSSRQPFLGAQVMSTPAHGGKHKLAVARTKRVQRPSSINMKSPKFDDFLNMFFNGQFKSDKRVTSLDLQEQFWANDPICAKEEPGRRICRLHNIASTICILGGMCELLCITLSADISISSPKNLTKLACLHDTQGSMMDWLKTTRTRQACSQ